MGRSGKPLKKQTEAEVQMKIQVGKILSEDSYNIRMGIFNVSSITREELLQLYDALGEMIECRWGTINENIKL